MGEARIRVGIVADDLTGAGDVAAGLAGRGLHTVGLVSEAGWGAVPEEAQVVVWNAETRLLAPGQAGPAFVRAARRLSDRGWPLVYKKIDSQLRGHVAEELAAALEAFPQRGLLLAPANPGAGRCTREGVQYIAEPSGRERAVRIADRLSPPLTGRLQTLSLEQVRQAASRWIERLSRPGQVVIGDAETADDLREWVRLAQRGDPQPLLCGSAGLADALGWVMTGREAAAPPAPRPAGAAVAVLVGSASEVTRMQVEALRSRRRMYEVVAGPADAPEALERAAAGLERAARSGPVLVWTRRPTEEPDQAGREGDAPGLTGWIGQVAGRLARQAGVRRWLVVGGQTASAVAGAIGLEAVRWVGEIAPGVVAGLGLGRAAGHVFAGKPGAFGHESTLVQALAWLEGGDP